MSRYEVRIVLNGADWESYKELHHRMSNSGYSRKTNYPSFFPHFSSGVDYTKHSLLDQATIFSEVYRIASLSGCQPMINVQQKSDREELKDLA